MYSLNAVKSFTDFHRLISTEASRLNVTESTTSNTSNNSVSSTQQLNSGGFIDNSSSNVTSIRSLQTRTLSPTAFTPKVTVSPRISTPFNINPLVQSVLGVTEALNNGGFIRGTSTSFQAPSTQNANTINLNLRVNGARVPTNAEQTRSLIRDLSKLQRAR